MACESVMTTVRSTSAMTVVTVILFFLNIQIIPIFAATPPDIASEVTIKDITTTGAKASWSKTDGDFDSYAVTISPSAGVSMSPNPIAAIAPNPETIISNLAPGTQYNVSVVTEKNQKQGNAKTATFVTQPNPVNSTTIVISKVEMNSATATWTAPPGSFDKFLLKGVGTTSIDVGTAVTKDLTGLNAGTEYTLTIVAVSGTTESDAATKIFKTKPAAVSESTMQIENLTPTSADLVWQLVTDGNYDNHTVSITPSSNSEKVNPATVAKETNMTKLENLQPGTEYNATVRTKYGSRESAASKKTFTTKPRKVDLSQVSFSKITETSVEVTFGRVPSADSYGVAIISTTKSVNLSPSSNSTTSFTGLIAGTEYNVSFTSKKSGVNGDTVYKTFKTKPPAIPDSIAQSDLTTTSASFSWSKPASGTFTSYTVTATAEEPGVTAPTVTQSSVPASEQAPKVSVTGLKAGLVYTVSVKTILGGDESTPRSKKFRTLPDKIGKLSYENLGMTTVTLLWTPLTVEAKYAPIYKYELQTNDTKLKFAQNPVSYPVNTINATGLTPGKAYMVNVRSVVGISPLETKSDWTSKTFTAKPVAISLDSVAISSLSTKTATVMWSKVTDGLVTSYNVSIDQGSVDPSQVTNLLNPSTQLKSLIPGAQHTLTIFAISGTARSAPVVKKFYTIPEQITGLDVVSIATTSATVNWVKVTNGSVDNYTVTVTPSGLAQISVPQSASPTADLTKLTPGRQYVVSVASISGDQKSSPVNKTFWTKPESVVETSIDVENVTTESAAVMWPRVVTGEFEVYRIAIHPSGPNIDPSAVNNTEETPVAVLTNLLPGNQYTVTIVTVAGDMVTESDPANLTFYSMPLAVDVASIVIHNNESDSASVSWKVVNGTFDKFVVLVSPFGPDVSPQVIRNGEEPRVLLTKLVPGHQYSVIIVTVSGYQNSTSAPQNFTTKPLSPISPTLVPNTTDSKAYLTWSDGVGSQQSSYKVNYRSVFRNSSSVWATNSMATRAFIFSYLPGEKYEVQVFAVSGNQESDPAIIARVTEPLPPSAVGVNSAKTTTSSLDVTWSKVDLTKSYFIKYIVNYVQKGSNSSKEVTISNTSATTKTLTSLTAGFEYTIKVFTATKDDNNTRSTSKETKATVMPKCNVTLADVSSKTTNNKLVVNYTENPFEFTHYEFTIDDGVKESPQTRGKTMTPREIVFDKGVQAGAKYTVTVTCISNGVKSTDSKKASVSSVPNKLMTSMINSTKGPHDVAFMVTKSEDFGIVGTVEVECKGTGSGCTKKSLVFSQNKMEPTFKNLNPFTQYSFIFTVISNNKKSGVTVINVTTPEYRPEAPASFRAEADGPNLAKLRWDKPTTVHGIISTYELKYTGVYKNRPHDIRTKVFNVDPKQNAPYVRSVPTLGGYSYTFTLFGKTSHPEDGINAIQTLNMPVGKPITLPGKEPASPKISETLINVTIFMAFNETQGPVDTFSIIVAEVKDDKVNEVSEEFTFNQVKASNHWFAYAAIYKCDIFNPSNNCNSPKFTAKSRRKRSTNNKEVQVSIGNQNCEKVNPSKYCNGPLKPGSVYKVKLRGYTIDGQYSDTPYSEPIKTAEIDKSPIIIGVTLGLVILLVAAVAVALVLYLRYKRTLKNVEEAYKESTDSTRPVRLSDFPDHYSFMHADTDFRFAEEYEDLKNVGIDQAFNDSELPYNRTKNRFTNILPYNWSRVKLSPVDDMEGTDYINANYIPGFSSRREYIACQGPLTSTKDDFWRMIWELNCQAIVMLTRCVENGREKCSHYWPEDTDPVCYDDIEVVILNETQNSDFTITQLRMTKGDSIRRITHFHFRAWPDFSAPDQSGPLLRFLQTFRTKVGFDSKRPICVHCSAGVGRSGTFITLDRLTQHMKQHDFVDVFGTVYQMRMHRRYMVQTEQQYIFIHRAILDILTDKVKQQDQSLTDGQENQAFEDDEEDCYVAILPTKRLVYDEGITLEVLS